jgi:hypothetical protein
MRRKHDRRFPDSASLTSPALEGRLAHDSGNREGLDKSEASQTKFPSKSCTKSDKFPSVPLFLQKASFIFLEDREDPSEDEADSSHISDTRPNLQNLINLRLFRISGFPYPSQPPVRQAK